MLFALIFACAGRQATDNADNAEDTPVENDADTDADSDSDTDADSDADSDADADSDSDSDSDTDTDISAPWEGLSADPNCEEVTGQAVPGATSYFWGDFNITGDIVKGDEGWTLLSNQAWRDEGGSDCVVVWSAAGGKASPSSACPTCDYSFGLFMSIDESQTTCPEGLYSGDESFAITYNIAVDGRTTDYSFASSGDALGVGETDGTRSTYLAESTCKYFGR
ncbi:MAG: hypothetical protein ACI9VR_000013 [Cognaticolwellia sp.]|jgi:hypothetical protein